jgi:UDP-N-acetylmuramate dehydrogenase
MLEIKKKFNLLNHNTFKLNSIASAWFKASSIEDIINAIDYSQKNNLTIVPIGDGSNILLGPSIKKLVLDINLKGIKLINQDSDTVLIEVGAGENWHKWVCTASNNSWYGLENLALIPGRVGAAPIQNIGAYGVEVSDFIESVKFIDLNKDKKDQTYISSMKNHECDFCYRNSIFKSLKNSLIITSVTFRLKKKFDPNLTYSSLAQTLEKNISISSQDIINNVTNIRNKKLPNPSLVPNAGSFFKNIEMNDEEFKKFIKKNPNSPFFKNKEIYKIPSAWLIDQCGYKSIKYKTLSMHKEQALVMINSFNKDDSNTSNRIDLDDVIFFSNKIKKSVHEKFEVKLDIEPQIIS